MAQKYNVKKSSGGSRQAAIMMSDSADIILTSDLVTNKVPTAPKVAAKHTINISCVILSAMTKCVNVYFVSTTGVCRMIKSLPNIKISSPFVFSSICLKAIKKKGATR